MSMISEIGTSAMLEQLAEEAAELAKAALKAARIERGENPTPVTDKEAWDNLREEYTDTVQCARELGLIPDEVQMDRKFRRFQERMKEKKK